MTAAVLALAPAALLALVRVATRGRRQVVEVDNSWVEYLDMLTASPQPAVLPKAA